MNFRTSQPIAREAVPFAIPPAVLGAGFVLGATALAGDHPPARALFVGLGSVLLALSAYVVWFFRHPRRQLPEDPAAIVSPADGTIVAVGPAHHPDFPNGQALRVAIFMSLFDVHINWSPCDGVVERVEYYPGKFLNAMDDKASEENERKVLNLRTKEGDLVVVKLIAGLVARRIVSPVARGDTLARGETIGLIRFGSRVEICVPPSYHLFVEKGTKVRGRETILFRVSREPSPASTERG